MHLCVRHFFQEGKEVDDDDVAMHDDIEIEIHAHVNHPAHAIEKEIHSPMPPSPHAHHERPQAVPQPPAPALPPPAPAPAPPSIDPDKEAAKMLEEIKSKLDLVGGGGGVYQDEAEIKQPGKRQLPPPFFFGV